jgi:hypothetical protein
MSIGIVTILELGNLLADSHSILNRRKNYFYQPLTVHDVKQTEIHTAKPLMPEPNPLEVETVIKKLKRHKLKGTD